MRRPVALALLALGTVAGYGSAFHEMRLARQHRASFERHVAQVCVDAARTGGRADAPQE